MGCNHPKALHALAYFLEAHRVRLVSRVSYKGVSMKSDRGRLATAGLFRVSDHEKLNGSPADGITD